MKFNGKTVFVTGAASGIGYACCKRFICDGANVVMCDVNASALTEKADILIKNEVGSVLTAAADVRNYGEIKAAFAKTADIFGAPDVLICCAGGTAKRILGDNSPTFWETPVSVYDWGIDVNLKGPFYCAHAAMPYMTEKRKGVIITLGSVTGEDGDGIGVDYATSKSALMYGFTKSIAKAGAPYGIRACCVSPGPVLTRSAMANMPTLMHRAANPEEIVNAIYFLASDDASFITGVNLLADGGHVITDNKTWGAV